MAKYFDVLGYVRDGEVNCLACFKGDTKDDPEVTPVFAGEEHGPGGVYCGACGGEIVAQAEWYAKYHEDSSFLREALCGRGKAAYVTRAEFGERIDKAAVRMILAQDREGDEARSVGIPGVVSSYLECARAAWDKELKAGKYDYWCGVHRALIEDE